MKKIILSLIMSLNIFVTSPSYMTLGGCLLSSKTKKKAKIKKIKNEILAIMQNIPSDKTFNPYEHVKNLNDYIIIKNNKSASNKLITFALIELIEESNEIIQRIGKEILYPTQKELMDWIKNKERISILKVDDEKKKNTFKWLNPRLKDERKWLKKNKLEKNNLNNQWKQTNGKKQRQLDTLKNKINKVEKNVCEKLETLKTCKMMVDHLKKNDWNNRSTEQMRKAKEKIKEMQNKLNQQIPYINVTNDCFQVLLFNNELAQVEIKLNQLDEKQYQKIVLLNPKTIKRSTITTMFLGTQFFDEGCLIGVGYDYDDTLSRCLFATDHNNKMDSNNIFHVCEDYCCTDLLKILTSKQMLEFYYKKGINPLQQNNKSGQTPLKAIRNKLEPYSSTNKLLALKLLQKAEKDFSKIKTKNEKRGKVNRIIHRLLSCFSRENNTMRSETLYSEQEIIVENI